MMQSDDARYLKRRVKSGSIDVHPTEKAIVVSYEVEATILGEMGDPMLGEKKECRKVIRLQSLNEHTDIKTLAIEVVKRCSLIPETKIGEVEQLLYYLQRRKETDKGKSGKGKNNQGLQDPTPDFLTNASISDMEIPSINNIDDYVELLYEDVPSKIKASIMIFCLIKNSDNLEALLEHGTVMGALSRVLREDWRKSVELSTNIMYIFFCFSTYIQFHQVIAHYKIGALCMSIAEHELKRLESWKDDLRKKKKEMEAEENQEQGLADLEKYNKKFQTLAKKQDQLLKVAFYLLLNLSEDTRVELKMKNKGIVKILIKALETRSNTGLNIVVVTFLKKLSIFKENKNEMAKLDIIPKLYASLTSDDELLSSLTLRLLLNLSFDVNLRLKMVASGFLPNIINYMGAPGCEPVTLCLLYHLSIDDKTRSMLAFTDCIKKVVDMILEAPAGPIFPELAALAINIATRKNNTQVICDLGNGSILRHLVKRVFKCKDGLLLKMIRNMSQHEGPTKSLFVNFISSFANALKKEKDEDFVIECLGTLANLNFRTINFDLILKKYELLPYILNVLKSANSEDDIVLETIVLVGTVALDENCAATLAQSGIVQVLVDLLQAKQEDDEVVLQIAYVFYQMIWHEETRNIIISNTQAPAYLIDLMHDRNSIVRNVCDNTLDIIREYDSDWEKRIQFEKFRWHNSQWVGIIGTQQMDEEEEDDLYESGLLPQYYHGDDFLMYEPSGYEDELMMENPAAITQSTSGHHQVGSEYDQVAAMNEAAILGFPPQNPTYMGEYIDGNEHNRMLVAHQDPYYQSPPSFARPSTPDYTTYNY